MWKLSDVVFLDDSPSILGRVIAIDRQQVVVDCDFTGSNHDGESNVAKSTLKVFRLVDLESCIEGPEYRHTAPHSKNEGVTSKNVSMATSDLPSGSHGTREVSQPAISRHVAGTVQHRPVCILDPNLARNVDMSISNSIPHPPSERLRGLRPLAVQATDTGPNLLVERVSDQLVFLVSSAHSTTSALNMSSFVCHWQPRYKSQKVHHHRRGCEFDRSWSDSKPISHSSCSKFVKSVQNQFRNQCDKFIRFEICQFGSH